MPQTTELNKAAPAEERGMRRPEIVTLDGLSHEEWLRARFAEMPHRECERCFRDASLHEVEFDLYGEPTIVCVTANGYRR